MVLGVENRWKSQPKAYRLDWAVRTFFAVWTCGPAQGILWGHRPQRQRKEYAAQVHLSGLQPSAGAVYLDGRSLEACSFRESAKRVAVLAQHNFYNFDFTVQDVVLMGRAPHKKALERDNAQDYHIVREALETVGMESFRTRSFSSLSGGEQQRVILARALAQQTPCLVLDEPTNHLDIKYQLQLMDIVKKLNRTIIAAIHDLNIAAMYCTFLYVMKDGKVVQAGPPGGF